MFNFESLLFLIIAGAAFTYAGIQLKNLFLLAKAHQGTEKRCDRLGERITLTVLNVLGQKAVLQKKWIGILHATIFWGFLLITIGTLEQFLSTLIPGVSFEFLGKTFYSGLLWTQDLFTVLVFLAVLGGAYRRLIVKPAYVTLNKDANFILLFTGLLMISILLMNAFHIMGAHPWYENSLPFSASLSEGLLFLNLDPHTALLLGKTFKWVHMLIVLGFGMYIPSSKHLHVLAAGPNTFFQTIGRSKGMKPIDFEDETLEQYGTAKVTDLSWKDALDYYSCTECGRCQEVCPAWNTEKPLSPKKLISDLKYNLFRNKEAVLKKDYEAVSDVIDHELTSDVIWSCTSCRACEIACPVFIEHTDKIYDIRRDLVMMKSEFPSEVQTVFKNMETNATPWAFSADDRDAWCEDLPVKKMNEVSSPEELDYLLWVGCAGAYDDRNKKVLRSFTRILNKADVKFAILGKEEQCTGDPARRIGNEYLFQTLATANVETLNRYSVKKVVTACPHCFNTLKNEYGDFGGNYEVIHHTQLMADLIQSGKIKPSQSLEQKITYHDSCYLGRWNDEYSAPRKVLESVAKKPVEMKAHHDQSMCCGAGGGRMWMEETLGKRINVTRTEQALETGASVVASGCPFCMTMISDGLKTKDHQDTVLVKDLAEILDDSLTD